MTLYKEKMTIQAIKPSNLKAVILAVVHKKINCISIMAVLSNNELIFHKWIGGIGQMISYSWLVEHD